MLNSLDLDQPVINIPMALKNNQHQAAMKNSRQVDLSQLESKNKEAGEADCHPFEREGREKRFSSKKTQD